MTAKKHAEDKGKVKVKAEVKAEETQPQPQSEPKSQPHKHGYKVVKEFRDIKNFNTTFKKGDDVSHLPDYRLAELEKSGLIQKH